MEKIASIRADGQLGTGQNGSGALYQSQIDQLPQAVIKDEVQQGEVGVTYGVSF